MAEYIVIDVPDYKDRVCFDCERDACVEVGCPHAPTAVTARPRERIVRCRDCKHYFNDPDDIYYAYQIPVCMYFADHDGFNAPCVKPDGFCAWGERRDDD